MKKAALLLFASSLSVMASPLKFGADAGGILTIPSFSGTNSPDGKVGFGGKIAGAVQYDVNDKFGVRGSVGYEFTTWGTKKTSKVVENYAGNYYSESGSATTDLQSHFVTIGADALFAVIPQVQLIGGLGVDIPLHTHYSSKKSETQTFGAASVSNDTTISGNVGKTQTSFFLNAGLGYKINPAWSVQAKYKFPVTDFYDHNDDEIKLSQILVGVSYNFGE